MQKPRPLFPGPRPPYLEAYVKNVGSKLDAHLADADDPHGTLRKVPLVYAGVVPPVLDSKYKETDLYIDTAAGKVYRLSDGSWNELSFDGVSKALAGTVVPLDTENDLYGAVDLMLRKMGATVS